VGRCPSRHSPPHRRSVTTATVPNGTNSYAVKRPAIPPPTIQKSTVKSRPREGRFKREAVDCQRVKFPMPL
jgi:hypothetical protein